MYEEMREYYEPIDADKMSASIKDVIRFLINFDEEIAEYEGKSFSFEIYWHNNKIVIETVKTRYSNEYRGGHDDIDTITNKETILKINASAIEYADMLVDFIRNRRLYKEIYGNRRINQLDFLKSNMVM